MLNFNMCTNQWVETSISIFATYWGFWMFMNVLHVFLVLSSWHTAGDHCETPAVCQKMWENIGDYDVKTKPFSPAEPYINNVKKIHLLQIKYNYDWCSAALAAVHVNYYILKLQGPQQNSLGSSEDICRCCGLHIPHCSHSQSSVLFMQARLVHLSSWIRIQTHALTNTREYITDFIGGVVSEITESWVKVR